VSRNYSEIQKEGRTIPLLDILSRGHEVSMDQKRIFDEDSKKNLQSSCNAMQREKLIKKSHTYLDDVIS
jgi:hypothetical protein